MKGMKMHKNRMRIKGIFPVAEGTVEGFGKPVRRGRLGQKWR